MVTVDSCHGRDAYGFAWNLPKYLSYRGILIIGLENGFERKKIIYENSTEGKKIAHVLL